MSVRHHRIRMIMGLAAALVLLLFAGPQAARAEFTWYIPVVDDGQFDQIQILMAPGYQFGTPAMTAFSGPDALGNPSAPAEQWSQIFINEIRDYAYAQGPSSGFEFLAFTIWFDGNPQVDRPSFHYQTYLQGSLVSNWDFINTGPGLFDWNIMPGSWTATQTFPPWLPGDADFDTDVDIFDFAIWQRNYTGPGGSGKTWGQGDWNGDGAVDIYDFALWQLNYTGPHAPEPATAALLSVGLGLLLKIRRRAKR